MAEFVNVRLLVDTLKGVIVAPTEAVQRGPDGTYVYVVGANNIAEMRQVKISRQDDKYAVIADGLTAGEKVVTSGFGRLKDGATVSVTDGNAAPADKPAMSKKPSDGKKAAQADNPASGAMQAAQALPQAAPQISPEAALVTGSTSDGGKESSKLRHSHRDSGASP